MFMFAKEMGVFRQTAVMGKRKDTLPTNKDI